MARNRYMVAYDVADPQRLMRTYKTMLGYGDRMQYSVFSCDLSSVELARMREDLAELLDYGKDRVLIVDVGPSYGGGADSRIEAIGTPLESGGRRPSIVV